MILSGSFGSVIFKAIQALLETAAESFFYLNICGDSAKNLSPKNGQKTF